MAEEYGMRRSESGWGGADPARRWGALISGQHHRSLRFEQAFTRRRRFGDGRRGAGVFRRSASGPTRVDGPQQCDREHLAAGSIPLLAEF